MPPKSRWSIHALPQISSRYLLSILQGQRNQWCPNPFCSTSPSSVPFASIHLHHFTPNLRSILHPLRLLIRCPTQTQAPCCLSPSPFSSTSTCSPLWPIGSHSSRYPLAVADSWVSLLVQSLAPLAPPIPHAKTQLTPHLCSCSLFLTHLLSLIQDLAVTFDIPSWPHIQSLTDFSSLLLSCFSLYVLFIYNTSFVFVLTSNQGSLVSRKKWLVNPGGLLKGTRASQGHRNGNAAGPHGKQGFSPWENKFAAASSSFPRAWPIWFFCLDSFL